MLWRPVRLILMLLALQGCDSYSLLEQFDVGEPTTTTTSTTALTLAAAKTTVVPNQTVALYPAGGREPYSYGVVANDLAYSGTLGSVVPSPLEYTSGTSIGTVDVRVTDADGTTASVTVTIVPEAPQSFVGSFAPSPPTVTLTWTYSAPASIDGFKVWSSTGGIDTFQTPALGSGVLAWSKQGGGTGNTYWVVAYKGSFTSASSPLYSH